MCLKPAISGTDKESLFRNSCCHFVVTCTFFMICYNLFSIPCSTNSGNGWGTLCMGNKRGITGTNFTSHISPTHFSFSLTKVFTPISSTSLISLSCGSAESALVSLSDVVTELKSDGDLRVLLGPATSVVLLLLAISSSLSESFQAYLTYELIED